MKKILLTTAISAALFAAHAYAADKEVGTDTVTPAEAAVENVGNYGPGTADPNESPKAAAGVSVPRATYYTPDGGAKKMTFGQLVGRHIKDAKLSDFKTALEASDIGSNFDQTKGFTVFAPVNGKFDAGTNPVDHYVVNGRYAFNAMPSNDDHIASMHGDKLHITHVGNSYFVDGLRVNGADRHADGVIYTIGGSAGDLHF